MPEIGEIKKGTDIGRKDFGKWIWHACMDCGRQRWVKSFDAKNVSSNLRCRGCGQKNRWVNSPKWKYGRRIEGGYVFVKLQPDDFFLSMTDSKRYVPEHRLVVAKTLGRCLHRWELVHHKHTRYPAGSVEDKQDNRPENLQLITDDRHKQITILEMRIANLEKRIMLLETENIVLKSEQTYSRL